jgi:hypothetical protein
VVLRVEGDGVDVDTNGGDVGVVLEGLDQVEVLALTLRETVVAVQLDLRNNRGVLAGKTLNSGDGVARLEGGAVKPVRVVEGLLALVDIHGAVALNERITLDNPDELLARVVEGHLDLVEGGSDRLIASELELLNEVLMGNLGEAAALLSVEVDVVDVEGSRDKAGGVDAILDGLLVGPAEVAELVEVDVDLDLVVLEGNEGEGKASVAVEPELEGDVEGVLRGARAALRRGVGLTTKAVIIATTVDANLGEGVNKLRDIANHLGVTGLLASGAGKLVPDVEPVTVMLVNALTTDLDLDVLDQVVANPVEPAELSTRAILSLEGNLGEGGLEVDTVDQITVAADGAGNTLTEVGDTIEGLLDRLHREVGVATIELLEEGDLGIGRQVNILSTVGDELHETTGHCLYSCSRKFFG